EKFQEAEQWLKGRTAYEALAKEDKGHPSAKGHLLWALYQGARGDGQKHPFGIQRAMLGPLNLARADTDAGVRMQEAGSEGNLEGAVGPSIDLFKDPDAAVRQQIAAASAARGGLAAATVDAAAVALDDADPFVRHALVKALKARKDWTELARRLKEAK